MAILVSHIFNNVVLAFSGVIPKSIGAFSRAHEQAACKVSGQNSTPVKNGCGCGPKMSAVWTLGRATSSMQACAALLAAELQGLTEAILDLSAQASSLVQLERMNNV